MPGSKKSREPVDYRRVKLLQDSGEQSLKEEEDDRESMISKSSKTGDEDSYEEDDDNNEQMAYRLKSLTKKDLDNTMGSKTHRPG